MDQKPNVPNSFRANSNNARHKTQASSGKSLHNPSTTIKPKINPVRPADNGTQKSYKTVTKDPVGKKTKNKAGKHNSHSASDADDEHHEMTQKNDSKKNKNPSLSQAKKNKIDYSNAEFDVGDGMGTPGLKALCCWKCYSDSE
ncbi:11807_t:CDS:1 [Paraglomus brasilianum]|uniref:11807_t:CDS:1 n=1 Tax=Paraglomus brasilianum TaxID=144538 RepID=A0A9N9FBS6_9GLOM|nr:11807_t:CDS:1 [Paraglomus brasilianum]